MRRVDVTSCARRDLLEIWSFIARDSIETADRIAARFQSEFQKLAEFPGVGHQRKELDSVYRV